MELMEEWKEMWSRSKLEVEDDESAAPETPTSDGLGAHSNLESNFGRD